MSLSFKQERALRRFVAGREVHDLGAGGLKLSRCLIDLGARYVYAVDKRYKHVTERPEDLPPRIELMGEYFADYAKTHRMLDVAFISWPQQHAIEGLRMLACVATTVVYIGSNFDGNACGNPDLFRYFRTREVLSHVPDRPNTMLIYGRHLSEKRPLLPEEYAGLYPVEEPYEYGSLDAAAE